MLSRIVFRAVVLGDSTIQVTSLADVPLTRRDALDNIDEILHNSPSRTRTYDLAVNPPLADRRAQKSFVFSILASFCIFARVRILSRFLAFYRGIRSAKRYKTVVAFWRFAGRQD